MKIRTITVKKSPKLVALGSVVSHGKLRVTVRPMTMNEAGGIALDPKAKPIKVSDKTWNEGIRFAGKR